jgi:hypothetical protein
MGGMTVRRAVYPIIVKAWDLHNKMAQKALISLERETMQR